MPFALSWQPKKKKKKTAVLAAVYFEPNSPTIKSICLNQKYTIDGFDGDIPNTDPSEKISTGQDISVPALVYYQ